LAPQTWNPQDYGQNARFVTDLGSGVVDLLAPRPSERVLDLVCGDGVLTKKLADLGCVVVGVDSSPEFLQAAQALGVDARRMDGQALTFNNEFNAVFSNAALHWMKQAEKVIHGVGRPLKPGGRFVAEMGGKGNIAQIETATRLALKKQGLLEKVTDPNYYPSPEEYRVLLEKRGFRVAYLNHFSRPTPLPKDMKTWLRTFRKSYLEVLPPNDIEAFLEEVQEALRPTLCDAQGLWTTDYVRLRFSAFKVQG
jgi:trans-aconitate methyltransferase